MTSEWPIFYDHCDQCGARHPSTTMLRFGVQNEWRLCPDCVTSTIGDADPKPWSLTPPGE